VTLALFLGAGLLPAVGALLPLLAGLWTTYRILVRVTGDGGLRIRERDR
jgi:hypothetical protein